MTRLTTATALGLILTGCPALAELTPREAWDGLAQYYEKMDTPLTVGSMDEAGDTLTLRDVKLVKDSPGGSFVVDFGDAVLTQNGDGSVNFDLEDEAKLNLTLDEPELNMADDDSMDDAEADTADESDADLETDETDADENVSAESDEDAELSELDELEADLSDLEEDDWDLDEEDGVDLKELAMTFAWPNETITVSRDGEVLNFVSDVAELTFSVDKVVTTDGEVTENPAKLVVTNLHSEDTIGERSTQTLRADSAQLSLDITDPEAGALTGTFELSDIQADGESFIPAGEKVEDNFTPVLKAGMTLNGTVKIGQIKFDFSGNGEDDEGEVETMTSAGSVNNVALNASLSKDGIRYEVTNEGGQAQVESSDLPQKVGYTVESGRGLFSFPLIASETPQLAQFAYALNGMQLTDETWALFDETGKLPHEPMSLNIDLGANVILERDLLEALGTDLNDPDLTEEERDALIEELTTPPGKVTDISVNAFDLGALGALAKVTGNLTVPEDGEVMAPLGEINARFEGVNGLLNALVEAGLIPADQLTGIRMGMAMFARPADDGSDAMTTDLEFKEDGQIFANGQRVK